MKERIRSGALLLCALLDWSFAWGAQRNWNFIDCCSWKNARAPSQHAVVVSQQAALCFPDAAQKISDDAQWILSRVGEVYPAKMRLSKKAVCELDQKATSAYRLAYCAKAQDASSVQHWRRVEVRFVTGILSQWCPLQVEVLCDEHGEVTREELLRACEPGLHGYTIDQSWSMTPMQQGKLQVLSGYAGGLLGTFFWQDEETPYVLLFSKEGLVLSACLEMLKNTHKNLNRTQVADLVVLCCRCQGIKVCNEKSTIFALVHQVDTTDKRFCFCGIELPEYPGKSQENAAPDVRVLHAFRLMTYQHMWEKATGLQQFLPSDLFRLVLAYLV